MSEVISFRLNKNNPREARALNVIRDWFTEGYSIRHIITEALLRLDGTDSEQVSFTANELITSLHQINQLLEQLGNGDSTRAINQGERQESTGLTATFIASVKKSAKQGIKID